MRNFLNVAPTTLLVFVLLALTVVAFGIVRSRAMAAASGDSRKLHSLPNYYGYNAALFTAIPSLFVLVVWLLIQPVVIQNAVIEMIPQSAVDQGSSATCHQVILTCAHCWQKAVWRLGPMLALRFWPQHNGIAVCRALADC